MLEEFVDALWKHKEDDRGWILIWDALYQPKGNCLVESKATWCCTTVEAVEAVRQITASTPLREIYIGAGLREKKHGKSRRGGSKDVGGVCGLWVEIDILGPAHSGKNYAPDEETAQKILNAPGLKPTIVLNSGHGLQAWWLFTDCLYFDSAKERDDFQELETQWQKTLSAHARELGGWAIDSTSDLARVLRVPETVNHKVPDLPAKVYLVDEDGPRYVDVSDFADRLAPYDKSKSPILSTGGNHGGPITIDENANPMVEKLEALKTASKKFKLAWERKRTDFHDQSASSYCMSMAFFAAVAGWSDQEIVDLLISWRRKENESMKLDRPEWYCDYEVEYSTIPKARRLVERSISLEELTSEETQKDSSDEIRKAISNFFQAEVNALIQHGEENSRWSLEMVDGRNIELGTSEQIWKIDHCRGRLSEKGIELPEGLKKIQWIQIMKRMQKYIRRLENPEVGDRRTTIREWVDDYLQSTPAVYSDSSDDGWEPAVAQRRPFTRNDLGFVYLHADHFRLWLDKHHKEQVKSTELHDMLRNYGFERLNVTAKLRTKSYWRYSLKTFSTKSAEPQGVSGDSTDAY